MFARSGLDKLNLFSLDDICSAKRRHPKSHMSVPSPVSDDENSAVSPIPKPRRIVVSNQLPIKTFRNVETGRLSFELDSDSLVLQLKDGFGPDTEVVYVGTLGSEVDPAEQEEVSSHLYETFRCVPTFLPPETRNRFYHGFCKHYLWPLFHYMLPVSPSRNARFDRAEWRSYVAANKAFADKITEVINPDEDFVWVHDYHLMILPTLLRKMLHRVKLGFFLHSPFPSSEIYRTIPVRNEILQSLLNSDLVGFHTFDYARHFLSCCSRMLGLDYQSKRGYIGLEYYGRTVTVKILPVGIHMGQLRSLLSRPETAETVKHLSAKFSGKTVFLGVDDMDMFKGISLKFLAFGSLLEQNDDLRGRVVLIQIANPARSGGKDAADVQRETESVADLINSKFGPDSIVFLRGRQVAAHEKSAYYSVADVCVVNAVRDGMNLVPYEYTVCRQQDAKQSVLVVSEFVGCSPSLSGAIRVNPWDVEAVAEAMAAAAGMAEAEKRLRHEKHYRYISSHDVAYWARSFDQDLERACGAHCSKRCWGIGLGLGFRVVALGPSFRRLSVDHVAGRYRAAGSRLILLDYDGTIKSRASVDRAPGEEIVSVLISLCDDPRNVVFVVSGRGRDPLGEWFSGVEKLGISAEHGFFTRWRRDEEWEVWSLTMDYDWKRMALPVMELYTEATDGSMIEQKESALVWHHQDADPHFGSCQAKELLDHLENVLSNEPVVVRRGQQIVEVKPQGVSKGIAVESLISKMQSNGKSPDFVLCIGDDHSDEDMFETISRLPHENASPRAGAGVFACTVGQKPSTAKYYLDDSTQVMNLLKGLASVGSPSSHQPMSNGRESFQGFI